MGSLIPPFLLPGTQEPLLASEPPAAVPDAPAELSGARRRLLRLGAVMLGGVWLLALAVLLFWPARYAGELSLILPNSDPDARVDLREVGQAYTTPRATYDSKSLDPRANYKQILLSAPVLEAAARLAGVDVADFGEPSVKLIDQSSVMTVRMSGNSPAQALAKTQAVHAAFSQRLSELRRDEMAQREQAIEQAVKSARGKLATAQQDMLSFKVGAQWVSEKQIEDQAMSANQLARKRDELAQKQVQARATVSSLSTQLGVAPRLAGWTITLQGDAVFLEHFKQYALLSAQLADYAHKWDENHPKVREAMGQRASVLTALLARARAVLGQPIESDDVSRMALVLQDRSREQLLRELVAAQAIADSAGAESAEVGVQLQRLRMALPKLAADSARFDDLQRRVQFSEAVFTGAVGKTDMGVNNLLSSYPLVQVMEPATEPTRPSFPRPSHVLAGAGAASLLVLAGLLLQWVRLRS